MTGDEILAQQRQRGRQQRGRGQGPSGLLVSSVTIFALALAFLFLMNRGPEEVPVDLHSVVPPDYSHHAIVRELEYLKERPAADSVAWYTVEDHTVYIGFRVGQSTRDVDHLVRGAAINASRVIDGKARAWGVIGARSSWRPGDSPQAFATYEGRKGLFWK